MKLNISTVLILILCVNISYQACCVACTSKLTSDTEKHESDSSSLPIVSTYETASTASEDIDADAFCGAVFTEFGTCCNQTELIARRDAWQKRIELRKNRTMNALKKLDTVVDQMENVLNFVQKKGDSLWDSASTMGLPFFTPSSRNNQGNNQANNADSTDTNNTNSNSNGLQNKTKAPTGRGRPKFTFSKPNETRFEELKNYFNQTKSEDKEKLKEKEQLAIEGQEECGAALLKMRENALCMRCSGAASDYYDETTKTYKISEDSCVEIIQKCAAVFSALAEANKLYTNLALLKKASGGTVSDEVQDETADDETINNWEECAANVTVCTANTTKVTELCSQFSISTDNQKIEGNPGTSAEGLGVSETLSDANGDASNANSNVNDLDNRYRLLEKVQNHYNHHNNEKNFKIRNLATTNADDGYGYASASTTGANLSSGIATGASSPTTPTTTTVSTTYKNIIVGGCISFLILNLL